MISRKEAQRVAKLARIGITKKEEEKFAKDLSSILDYIEKLKEVDVSNVKPTSLSLDIENVMRSDIEKPKTNPPAGGQKPKTLLDLMPEKKDGYLKTKSIL